MTLTDATAEVAGALGLQVHQLKRRWRKLHLDDGLPPPLPGGAWLKVSGRVVDAGANDNRTGRVNRAAVLIAAQQASLSERYGGRA
ncbi:hypothetical protein [Mangrovicella endophytica]|uniref:hypothetical protein n=1 Tax=Mangrovicella endophytica TaxID=2066697 RepID=UPI000C9E07D4|nr:hypothetical protein [Mangrovicella endophytica]